jgi:hypothetical protein
MIKDLAITEQRLKEIQQHTESDTQLQTLKHVIQSGWPEMKCDVSHDMMITDRNITDYDRFRF